MVQFLAQNLFMARRMAKKEGCYLGSVVKVNDGKDLFGMKKFAAVKKK